jgi:hypothetical protein
MQYKGEIKGFPQHVVEAMLDEQERQGNKRDVTVFEKNKQVDLSNGGFNWSKSVFGWNVWGDIIDNRKFHLIEQAKPQEPKKDRFPFTLSLEEAKRLVEITPKKWEDTLTISLGKLFMLGKDLTISENLYESMRKDFSIESNLVLDEIFGKDEEFIPDGTPCLVSYTPKAGWTLRYADGNGKFYRDGKKSGDLIAWNHYQVLDINNLPVNE